MGKDRNPSTGRKLAQAKKLLRRGRSFINALLQEKGMSVTDLENWKQEVNEFLR